MKKCSARIIMKRMNFLHRIFSISSAWGYVRGGGENTIIKNASQQTQSISIPSRNPKYPQVTSGQLYVEAFENATVYNTWWMGSSWSQAINVFTRSRSSDQDKLQATEISESTNVLYHKGGVAIIINHCPLTINQTKNSTIKQRTIHQAKNNSSNSWWRSHTLLQANHKS